MEFVELPRSHLGEVEPRTAPGAEEEGTTAHRLAEKVSLTLFIAGATRRSQKAVFLVKRLCEEQLPNAYELVVVDLYQAPSAARDAQVIVAPTLIRNHPKPVRRFSGDLSNSALLMARLDLCRGTH